MTPAGAFLSSLLPSAATEAIVVVCNCKHQSPLEILVLIVPDARTAMRPVWILKSKL